MITFDAMWVSDACREGGKWLHRLSSNEDEEFIPAAAAPRR